MKEKDSGTQKVASLGLTLGNRIPGTKKVASLGNIRIPGAKQLAC